MSSSSRALRISAGGRQAADVPAGALAVDDLALGDDHADRVAGRLRPQAAEVVGERDLAEGVALLRPWRRARSAAHAARRGSSGRRPAFRPARACAASPPTAAKRCGSSSMPRVMLPRRACAPSRRRRCSAARARRTAAVGLARGRRRLVGDERLGRALVGADAHQVDADAEPVERVLVVVAVAPEAFEVDHAERMQQHLVGVRGDVVLALVVARAPGDDLLAARLEAIDRRGDLAQRRDAGGRSSSRTTTRLEIFGSSAAASSTLRMSRSCTFCDRLAAHRSSADGRRLPHFCSAIVP